MGRIFLSYSRQDRGYAEALASILQEAGHEVWWDRHIDTGSQFSKEIERALDEAELIVVAWSRHAAESPWVRDEASIARDSGRLLPVTVDSSQPPLGFRQFQTLDLSHWRASRKDKRAVELLSAVDRRLKGSEAAAAPPAIARRPSFAPFSGTPGWRLAVGAAALLALAVAALLFIRAQRAEASSVTVAVLPFADLSATHDKAYLAEGIGEQILSSLGTVPNLRVIGRTSAAAIGAEPDPRKLRSALGITHVVEGSARTAANELRIDVRLIRTSDGSQIWTHEYRGSMNDIFRLQDDVARSLVDQLNLTLAPPSSPSTHASVDAYEMYLAARSLQRERTVPKLQEAMKIARQIVAAHPDYARGHALVSELTMMLSNSWLAYGDVPIAKARAVAVKEATQAIRLAPAASEGYAALGLSFADSPTPQSIAALEKAIRLDPSRAELRVWLGLSLDSFGRNDEEAEQFRLASEVEPLWPVPLLNWVAALSSSGRLPEALKAVDRFRRGGGAPAQAWRIEAVARASAGDLSGSVNAWRHALAIDPSIPQAWTLARILRYLGLPVEPALRARIPSSYFLDLIEGAEQRMRQRISADPATVWRSPGSGEVIRTLAKARDWRAVLSVYDAAPPGSGDLCNAPTYFVPTVAWALRQGGRRDEAEAMISCFQRTVSKNQAMTFRSANDASGELEEMQAAILALHNDRRAIDWLNRAVDRGWIGAYFSHDLHDWREFDAMWSDPRMKAVQQRIDRIFARERAETMQLPHS